MPDPREDRRIQWLAADTIWWGGRLRGGVALRVGVDGTVKPVPAEMAPADGVRRFPGTLLPGLVDAHVHSALADLGTVRAGGIAAVWDLGGNPAAVAALAARAAALAARTTPGSPTAPDADTRTTSGSPTASRTTPDAAAGTTSGSPTASRTTPDAAAGSLTASRTAPDAIAGGYGQVGPRLPRIRYAGPFLIAPGGYPSDRAWAPAGSWREITSEADAGAAVADAWSAGATLIKVTAHAGGPLLPQPILRALVDAAHASGLPVVAHAEGPGTVAAAVEAGVDLLAHTPWTESLPDTLIRACAGRMTWISTLDIHGWGDPDPAREVAVDNLRRFVEAGGKVRYGTDLGNGPLPPGVNPRELRALRSAGLTPDEILTSMTEPDSPEITWVPGGLDLSPAAFADSLATARVLDDSVQPRPAEPQPPGWSPGP
ncbi:amidohydrolase family protein [Actinoplanes ianthinogenes]|uniref:amidohydrolase family protein n=1 Tax=Actinoplanes ianthinogenes TaxID=122358 RepID=UPI001E65CF3A|nr:amidohydrolase family protein [Actinoplanes ianthinogenes]